MLTLVVGEAAADTQAIVVARETSGMVVMTVVSVAAAMAVMLAEWAAADSVAVVHREDGKGE